MQRKNKKLLKEILHKTCPTMEPYDTLDAIVLKFLFILSNFTHFSYLSSMNKYKARSFQQIRWQQIQQFKGHGVYGQKL